MRYNWDTVRYGRVDGKPVCLDCKYRIRDNSGTICLAGKTQIPYTCEKYVFYDESNEVADGR